MLKGGGGGESSNNKCAEAAGTSGIALTNGESKKTFGDFFKRLSPKYHRSRSRSPSSSSKGGKGKSKSSWVTVEIKSDDYADADHRPVVQVVRSGTDDGRLSSCSTGSVPGSPAESNGGFSPARGRSTLGSLFGGNRSGSFSKKHQQKSATLSHPTSARHENEPTSYDDHYDQKNAAATSAKSKFDAFIAQLSHKSGVAVDKPAHHRQSGSVALSEENLVSKSLVCEKLVGACSADDTNNALVVSTSAPKKSAVANGGLATNATVYHSQDSVFDSNVRIPSYVRLSCTLSGYKNYRNVDLRSPSPSRSPLPLSVAMPRIVENFPTTTATEPPNDQRQQHLPIGKSIVERRLEKFEHSTPQIATRKDDVMSVELADTAEATPTPVRNIISSFNRLTLHDTPARPRQKPPPVPPRNLDMLSMNNGQLNNGNGGELNEHVGHGETPNGIATRVNNVINRRGDEILLNGSDGSEIALNGIEIARPTGENGATFTSEEEVVCTFELNNSAINSRTTSDECFISAVVVEPVNGRVDKRIVEETKYEEEVTVENGGDHCGVIMNGLAYRKLAADERRRLEEMLAVAEQDLNAADLPEFAAEKVRIAVGKLKLLLRKKFATFENLIEKNLNPVEGDLQPTLDDDLDGYYGLVKIELQDIDKCFGVVERLRQSGWTTQEAEEVAAEDTVDNGSPKKVKKVSSKSSLTSDKEATAKAKEAARLRLKEAKMAAMQRNKNVDAPAMTDDQVQFFGAS